MKRLNLKKTAFFGVLLFFASACGKDYYYTDLDLSNSYILLEGLRGNEVKSFDEKNFDLTSSDVYLFEVNDLKVIEEPFLKQIDQDNYNDLSAIKFIGSISDFREAREKFNNEETQQYETLKDILVELSVMDRQMVELIRFDEKTRYAVVMSISDALLENNQFYVKLDLYHLESASVMWTGSTLFEYEDLQTDIVDARKTLVEILGKRISPTVYEQRFNNLASLAR